MIFYKRKYKKELQKKGYAESSIVSYIRRIELFEQWCKHRRTNSTDSDRVLAYNYLKHLQRQTSNYRTINRELQPLKLYCRLFKKDNPFHYLYIRKKEEKIKTNFFTKEELETIYIDYPQNTIIQIRQKILLGFYVFQGIKSSEAKVIELEDIDLKKCNILLKGDKRTDKRKISLNIKQILLLSEYINNHRVRLLKRRKSNYLIIVSKSRFAQQNLLQNLSNKLRKSIYGFQALHQLRASVIHIWVKEYDLRRAQYLSGHRHISTTEKFIIKDIKELQKAVDKFFPLNV